MNKEITLGIDPGSDKSGIIVLEDGKIIRADNVTNADLFLLIDEYTILNEHANELMVVYEDIRPYEGRMNMRTIRTIKMIGKLEYILGQRRIMNRGMARNEVKAFVFNQFKEHVIPDIDKIILRKGKVTKEGVPYKASFQYVNDRIVKKAMKLQWGIPTPRPGKRSLYGLSTHSWQALAVVSCYMHVLDRGELWTSDTSEN